MLFDVGQFAEKLAQASPKLSHAVSMKVLGFMSPFNSHLKATMKEWTAHRVTLTMKNHRRVKNHVGGVHAGALFTIGETCAGLLIVKNFSFKKYRPLMSEISAVFSKQARGSVKAVAKISAADLKQARGEIKNDRPAKLVMKTEIFDAGGVAIATVSTHWQIKQWSQVKTK